MSEPETNGSIHVDGGYGGGPRDVDVMYPSNSFKDRKPDAKPEPVTKVAHGRQVEMRKTLWERIKDLFLEPEGEPSRDYIYEDIIEPAIADGVSNIAQGIMDSLMGGINNFLFPNGGPRYYPDRGRTRWGRAYDEYYDDRNRHYGDRARERRAERDRRSRRSDDPAAMVETRDEAIRLIEAMQDRVHRYDIASVLNFYDMADMPTNSVDDRYGWDREHPFEASITYTRDGYVVTPSRPIPLDR